MGTRRSKAFKIIRLKDGRKVFIKRHTNQTKDSMAYQTTKPKTRAVCALRDRNAMMFMVRSMKIDHRNQLKLKQMTKAGKADKFKPIPLGSGTSLPKIVKQFYGPDIKEKNVVRITNLPEKASKKTVDMVLGRCSKYVKKIAVEDSVSKKNAGKNLKVALLHTESDDLAKAVLRHKSGKIKMSGKIAKLSVISLKDKPASDKRKKAEKEASKKKAAKAAAIRKGNHERHQQNLKDATRRRNNRRHPKYAGPKFIRDKKTGRLYAIKRSADAKAPKIERKPANRYKTMRAMVRATRK